MSEYIPGTVKNSRKQFNWFSKHIQYIVKIHGLLISKPDCRIHCYSKMTLSTLNTAYFWAHLKLDTDKIIKEKGKGYPWNYS